MDKIEPQQTPWKIEKVRNGFVIVDANGDYVLSGRPDYRSEELQLASMKLVVSASKMYKFLKDWSEDELADDGCNVMALEAKKILGEIDVLTTVKGKDDGTD